MGSPQSGKKQLHPKCDGQQRLAGRETAHGIADKRLSDDIAGTREAREDCRSAKIVAGIELPRLCSIIPDSRIYFHSAPYGIPQSRRANRPYSDLSSYTSIRATPGCPPLSSSNGVTTKVKIPGGRSINIAGSRLTGGANPDAAMGRYCRL